MSRTKVTEGQKRYLIHLERKGPGMRACFHCAEVKKISGFPKKSGRMCRSCKAERARFLYRRRQAEKKERAGISATPKPEPAWEGLSPSEIRDRVEIPLRMQLRRFLTGQVKCPRKLLRSSGVSEAQFVDFVGKREPDTNAHLRCRIGANVLQLEDPDSLRLWLSPANWYWDDPEKECR